MLTIFFIFAFIFGLIIGSFLNCLIWRVYKEETLNGRSYCPKCRKMIAWYDNIPLLSFIILGGRCRHCRQPISWQYPLVELVTALLFLLTFRLNILSAASSFLILRDWLIVATLLIIFVYDLRWQLIPMNVLWPLTATVFILNILAGLDWRLDLIYGLVFAAFFLLQYLITKKKGIGEGDIWLGLFLGLAFPNVFQLLLIILLAYCLGAVVGVILLAKQKKGWRSKVALGPFLAFGAIITLIWSEPLINWYLGLILSGH